MKIYIDIRIVSDKFTRLTTKYLRKKHPELSRKEAKKLLTFCHEHTIWLRDCYGNGEIMYHKFKNEKHEN